MSLSVEFMASHVVTCLSTDPTTELYFQLRFLLSAFLDRMLATEMGAQEWGGIVSDGTFVLDVSFELLAAQLSKDDIQLSLLSKPHL